MKGLLSVILLVLCVAFVSCKPQTEKLTAKKLNAPVPKFSDCGSQLSKVTSVTITPCDTNPCTLHKSKNSTIGVTFTVNKGVPDIAATKAAVHGIIAGIPAPFPIDNDNGCKDCGLTCPLKESKEYTYTYTLPIDKSFPTVECIVKWELQKVASKSKSNDDTEIFCIEVPVQVE